MVQTKTVVIIVIVIVVIALLIFGGYELYRWIKSDQKKAGEECTFDIECQSDQCARIDSAKAQEYCCNDGEKIVTYAGLDYCGNRKNGEKCLVDVQCQSGWCNGVDSAGRCEEKKKPGQTCDLHNSGECDKGCGYIITKSNPVCCTDKVVGVPDPATGQDDPYCGDVADGGQCIADVMCKSNMCTRNDGNVGKCYSPRPNGSPCSDSSECHNDRCGRKTVTSDDGICCPSDNRVYVSGKAAYYCTDILTKGEECYADQQCTSKKCDGGNPYVAIKGRCT